MDTDARVQPLNSAIQSTIERICPDLDPVTLNHGFADFWKYANEEGSAAYKAAPLFEEIRSRAMRKIAEARSAGQQTLDSPPETLESRSGKTVSVA